ncbi:hypothetical protein RHMOL_Rhmol13G0234900 [Rhododendron molle]|uniref:Uncharacterized protein n=1 Tax=Rhododendron molle TaxID=49168 RepID=A0ACC0LA50_RHOML|nr:hypothetical protein RHMOL_Rhmol13G0234900 [Rhododendron molle]
MGERREINGEINSLHEEKDYILDTDTAVKCFNWNRLHEAASRGPPEIFKKLLDSNPELAEALDSQQRSLLHLASANGHVEIVKEITKMRPEMCLARDRDGMNPFHVAAMRGMVEVLDVLFQANPHAARARVDRGERATILHLCIKYNKLDCLKLLLEKFKSEEFVNAKDDGGNTILHLVVSELAIADQRFEDTIDPKWLREQRNALIIVAVLMATIAFQAGITPPGGVWPNNKDGHEGGEAVMAYKDPHLYRYFLGFNTMSFVASLSTILLLICEFPFKKRRQVWMLILIMFITITSMTVTYALMIIVITPKWDKKILSRTMVVGVAAWCSVIAIVLTVHPIPSKANIVGGEKSKHQAVEWLRKWVANKDDEDGGEGGGGVVELGQFYIWLHHVRGQKELFLKRLNSNLGLAEALDLQQRSLLHLAWADGHIEIVKVQTKSSSGRVVWVVFGVSGSGFDRIFGLTACEATKTVSGSDGFLLLVGGGGVVAVGSVVGIGWCLVWAIVVVRS